MGQSQDHESWILYLKSDPDPNEEMYSNNFIMSVVAPPLDLSVTTNEYTKLCLSIPSSQ